MPSMSDLEESISLHPGDGPGEWRATADPRYESTNAMFGGWTSAVLLRAMMSSEATEAKPSAITVNYIVKVDIGSDVAIRTCRIGGGRSVMHWRAELAAGDTVCAHATAVLTVRRDTDNHTDWSMPDVGEPDSYRTSTRPEPRANGCLHRAVSGYPSFGRDDTTSRAWVRDLTGRPVDHLQLAFLADSYAPRSYFWANGPVWRPPRPCRSTSTPPTMSWPRSATTSSSSTLSAREAFVPRPASKPVSGAATAPSWRPPNSSPGTADPYRPPWFGTLVLASAGCTLPLPSVQSTSVAAQFLSISVASQYRHSSFLTEMSNWTCVGHFI